MPTVTVTPEILWQLRHDLLYPPVAEGQPPAKLGDMPLAVQAELWAFALFFSAISPPPRRGQAAPPPEPPSGLAVEETERIRALVARLAAPT